MSVLKHVFSHAGETSREQVVFKELALNSCLCNIFNKEK